MNRLLAAADDLVNQTGLGPTAQAGGLSTNTDLLTLVGNIISIILGVLGIIFFILILASGWQWMVSGGNEKNIAAAKQRLISATIGLAIILASWAIASFIIQRLATATS